MTTARSLLYVPADRAELVTRAGRRGADAVILDLEDAVPILNKGRAREVAAAALADGIDGVPQLWVRVNPISVEQGRATAADLAAVVSSRLAGVLVAKTESADDLRAVDAVIDRLESERGLLPSVVRVVPLVESARALMALDAIASAPRVARLQLGEADLAADLGLEAGDDEIELLSIRIAVVQISAALRLESPAGSASREIEDLARLELSSLRLRRLGFFGRTVIHPRQIPVVHKVFTPSEHEAALARDVVARFEQASLDGHGATVDAGGRMIDEAIVRSARRTIERAGATGCTESSPTPAI